MPTRSGRRPAKAVSNPSPLALSLINRLQGGFPLGPQPFAQAATALGCDQDVLIATLAELLNQGWLTRFGPLFNAERMGGGLVLAAMAVPDEMFDGVASRVNRFPEVAHNYRRDHRLNLWFVLATDSPAAIDETLHRIEAAAGLPVYSFPKEREFYLGLWLEIDADGERHTRSFSEQPLAAPKPLDALDRRIVAATQAGLPLVAEPWLQVAHQVGCSRDLLSERIQAMLASGVIRRIGVVPNHVRLGFRGNGMTVWDIPDERLDTVGRRIGELDFVSHCYSRPRHPPDWPYNLFAMVHGTDRAQVARKVAEMAHLIGPDSRAHDILYSSAVLKKTGLRLVD